MEKAGRSAETILKEVTDLLAELEQFQRMLTIMFTDVAGSTSYFERHGDMLGMLMLQRVESLVRPQVASHEGKVVKTIGDSVMAYFENPVKAVEAGIAMQRALDQHNRRNPEEETVRIRVAINLGVAILRGQDVFGDVVNVCSRIEHEAQPEEIWVSPSVVEGIREQKRFPCRKVGKVSLRGKAQDMDLYVVEWREGAAAGETSLEEMESDQLQMAAGSTAAGHDELRTMIAQVGRGQSTVTSITVLRRRFVLYEVLARQKLGRKFAVKEPCSVAGSAEGDIRLSGPFVAGQHATFTPIGGALYVDDISDGAGVFLRVKHPVRISDGDLLALGRQRFHFHILRDLEGEVRGAELRHVSDPEKRCRLRPGENTLGRKDCHWVFPDDKYLSRRHARLMFLTKECILEDLGSSNGTFVGIPERQLLNDGDDVLVGEKILRVAVEEF